MATLGYSWTDVKSGSQTKSLYDSYYRTYVDYTVTYTLQAQLSSQSSDENKSYINTRAQISITPGYIDTYNLHYSCTGCTSHNGDNSTRERVPTGVVLTGSTTVSHADNGTGSLSMSGSFSCNYGSYDFSVSGSITLPTIPRNSSITTFNAFTIEDGFSFGYKDDLANKTLTLTCKLGNTVILTKTYASSVGAHTDTITFTAAQLETIYGNTGLGTTNKSGTFTLILATSGITSTSSKTATGTLKTNDNKPTLSNAGMTETQLVTYGVGDTEIIRYLSKKRVFVTATGIHNATIASVKVKNGSSAETSMTLSNGVYSAVLQNLTNNTFTITATDSRGLTTTITLTGTLKNYTYPAITKIEFDRNSAVVSSGYLRPSGTYWNGTAGVTINAVTWKYSLNGATAVSGTTSELVMSSNTWSDDLSLSEGTLNREVAYECVVTVTDAFDQSASYTITIGVAQLSLWLGKYTVKADGIVANHFLGVFPVGSVYMSVTNVNPSVYFGGTWVQIAQGRTLIGVGSIEANTVNTHGSVTAGDFSVNANERGGTYSHTHGRGNLAAAIGAIDSNVGSIAYYSGSVVSGGPTTTNRYAYGGMEVKPYNNDEQYTFNHYTPVYGSTGATNEVTPYLAVYIWQRTA